MNGATLVGQTFSRWSDHEGQRLGAALAFYTLLSAAPLMVLLLLAVSGFYGREPLEQNIVHYLRDIVGDSAARLAEMFFASAHQPDHGKVAGIVAVATLLFGASAAFAELRDDLNKIWDARPRRTGLVGLIAQRIFAFVLVVAAGGLLMVLMLASTAVAFIGRFLRTSVPVSPAVLDAINFAFSFLVLMGIFVLIFRFVPDLVLPWRVLWTGAAVSALLLVIGKGLLGWYLGKAGVGSAYGAAGSVIAIAFWFYYSAQIFLLGAEFTYVWSRRRSS